MSELELAKQKWVQLRGELDAERRCFVPSRFYAKEREVIAAYEEYCALEAKEGGEG
jgi:hypothetical protein